MHRMRPEEAVRAGRRLKLSADMVSLASTLARRGQVGSGLPPAPRGREAVLFLWEVAPWEPEVILLEAARTTDVLDTLNGLLDLWHAWASGEAPQAPVDGVSLMCELGLGSGPLLGTVLREARLAWEAGEATDLDQVLAVARAALARGTSSGET